MYKDSHGISHVLLGRKSHGQNSGSLKSFRNNLEILCHPICNWLYTVSRVCSVSCFECIGLVVYYITLFREYAVFRVSSCFMFRVYWIQFIVLDYNVSSMRRVSCFELFPVSRVLV